MVKLSVVIPTYNRSRILEECLDSLILQECGRDEYEVIVVDDGSTDSTKQIVEDKSREGNVIYFYQKHAGTSEARNLGISNARGGIIAFVDDDCIIPKNWVSSVIVAHQMSSNIMAIQGSILNYLPHNIIACLEQEIWGLYWKRIIVNNSGVEFISMLGTTNCSLKREVFFDYKLRFRKELFASEDVELYIQMMDKKLKIRYSDKIFVFHRHSSNLFRFLKRAFRDGRGKFLLDLFHPRQMKRDPRIALGAKFFLDSCARYFTGYGLFMGLLMVFLHLLRKMVRISGYIYQIIDSFMNYPFSNQ